MKIKLFNIPLLFSLAFLLLNGCSDWTDTEAIKFGNDQNLDGTIKTDEYYAALREWKKTPNLPQIFVWFDNWNGVSPTGENSLRGLPDSVTIASNWGGHPKFELSPERKADMEYVQRVKGTKVVVTLFSKACGDDMPPLDIYNIGESRDPAIIRPALKAYAEAIYDAVVESGYDGYDWDYEPSHGRNSWDPINPLWEIKEQRTIFVEELSYWFGLGATEPGRDRGGRKPAKPGLLFIIDGEVGTAKFWGGGMDKDWLSYYVDYFVLQAYNTTSESGTSGLDARMEGVFDDMENWINEGKITKNEIVRRTLFTENFESHANTGGGFLLMSKYVYDRTGLNEQIGGCGLYRSGFDYNQGKGDYDGSPEYYFLRQGITNLYRNFYDRLNPKDPEPEQP